MYIYIYTYLSIYSSKFASLSLSPVYPPTGPSIYLPISYLRTYLYLSISLYINISLSLSEFIYRCFLKWRYPKIDGF